MKIGLIITAAGRSERFGSQNKLFIPINNKPLIKTCCERFSEIKDISETIITSLDKDQAKLKKALSDLPSAPRIVVGGETRKDSVLNAFKALSAVDLVMIHDGARPNVSEELIKRIIKASEKHQAVIPVIPITDTIKQVENNIIKKTLAREHIFKVQTPQIFHYDILKAAYEKYSDIAATDEASLVEKLNVPIYAIKGEAKNLKITTPEDVEVLKALIS
ncbi:2-C-methyl-D-erythritol 4-phosphate cytidylyltransferase [Candidatus Margulisiibacteriota bacterium]